MIALAASNIDLVRGHKSCVLSFRSLFFCFKEMVSLPSNAVNKAQIKRYIDSTFEERKTMRGNGDSASAIIDRFPKLLDYDGELVIMFDVFETLCALCAMKSLL